MLSGITGKEKVERLPIVVTQDDFEQLLSVPKLPAGSGKEIATAAFQQLEIWQILHYVQVQAICFDTTAANTGERLGF